MFLLLQSDPFICKNSAILIREIAKHTPELSALIVKSGGAAAVVDYINETTGNNKLPGIMTLGYVKSNHCC